MYKTNHHREQFPSCPRFLLSYLPPPPPSKELLAAFTIAPMASLVMSPLQRLTLSLMSSDAELRLSAYRREILHKTMLKHDVQ